MIKMSEFEESATMLAERRTVVRVANWRHRCEIQHTEEVCASRSRIIRTVEKARTAGQPRAVLPSDGQQG